MKRHPQGQYIIEIMLALGLFMMFVGSLSLLAIDAAQTTRFQEQQLQGMISLQNATEAIHSIVKNSWATLAIGTYGLELQSSQWTLSPSVITQNDITKKITVSYAHRNALGNIDPLGAEDQHTKQVDVEISRASTGKILFTDSLLFTQAIKQLRQWNETTSSDFADGIFTSTIGTTTGDGEITLAQSGAAIIGLPFYISSFSNTSTISDGNDRVSFRFTSSFSNPLSEIHVYVSNHTGSSSVFQFGIQADNAGLPSGTYLTSGTFVASTNGWRTVLLSPSYTPTSGEILHIVGQRFSGTNSITLRTSNPRQNIVPSSGQTDTAQQTLRTTNGTTWTQNNLQPVMLIEDFLGNFTGNTYTARTDNTIGGTNEVGEIMTFSQETIMQGVSFALSRSGNPADNLTLTIRDLTTNSVLGQETIATPAQVTSTTQWITANFSNSITIPATHTIRLELSSPGSTQSNRRYITPLFNSLAPAPYSNATYGGTAIYASIKTTTTWSANTLADIPFQLHLAQGYATNGTYESSAFDTGNSSTIFNAITWTAQTPAGTSVSFQTKTASSIAGLASALYVGPDGTPASNYTNGDTIGIDPGASGTQFIQYRIQLFGTAASAPQVEDVHITYE